MRKFTICLTFMIALSLPLGASASEFPWNLPGPNGLWVEIQTWFSTPWTTTKDGPVCDPNGAPAQCPSTEIGAALDPGGAPSDSEIGVALDPAGVAGE